MFYSKFRVVDSICSDILRKVDKGGRKLTLKFACAPDGSTFLDHQKTAYPFHVGRILRFAGDPKGMATVYLQSMSGGLYKEDRLTAEIDVAPRAMAHVTTQASTIVHDTQDGHATSNVLLSVGSQAFLEYLADPIILFPGARLCSSTRVNLAQGAVAIIGESFLAHDPKGRGRTFVTFENDLSVRTYPGRTVMRDRFKVDGEQFSLIARAGQRDYSVHATLMLLGNVDAGSALRLVRQAIAAEEANKGGIYAGASLLPESGIWMRALAVDGASMKRLMMSVWKAMRCAVTGNEPQIRRK